MTRPCRDGTRPPSFDKDVIRSWVVARCDPYNDPIPEIPPEMIAQTAQVYIDAFQAITGQPFQPDTSGATPLDRVRANLAPITSPPDARVCANTRVLLSSPANAGDRR